MFDKDLGFSTNSAHKIKFIFDEESQVWSSLNFYLFEPSRYKTAAEVLPILQQWVAKIDEAGWARGRFRDGEDQKLPLKETGLGRYYMTWKMKDFFLALRVERVEPKKNHKKMDNPGYYVRVELEKRRN